MRRSIFTEGKFLVYKSQDALRRQLKHCDKKHQWVNFTKTQGEVCGGSTDDDDGGGAAARILGAGPSRGVSDCWRLRIQIFSHFALAAANEGDVSAKTRWHKDKGMLPSNFEVLSTLWCLIERPHEDPNLADFWTHDGRMSLWVGRGMSLCKGSLAECLGCQAVPIGTPRLMSSATALPPCWETQWQASPETFYILPQQKKFSMFAQKQPSYIVLRLPQLLTIMGPTWNWKRADPN